MPLCGGVPPASITCAMMSVDPLIGSAVASDVSVMVDPLGASSGTFSHATARHARRGEQGAPGQTGGGGVIS